MAAVPGLPKAAPLPSCPPSTSPGRVPGAETERAGAGTRAGSPTIGDDSPKLTPQVSNQACGRTSTEFDNGGARTTIKADDILLDDLATADHNAKDQLTEPLW
jgi:hypothetical protein